MEIHFLNIREFPRWTAIAREEYMIEVRCDTDVGVTLSRAK
jgi:hypothetical protein